MSLQTLQAHVESKLDALVFVLTISLMHSLLLHLSFGRIYQVMDLFWISIILSFFIVYKILETNSEAHVILAGENESPYFERKDGSVESWDDHTRFPGMNSIIVIYPKT